jgi:hypothetical protein
MNVLSLVGRMTTQKYSRWKAGHPAAPCRTPAPLHLSQGATTGLSPVPLILAQAAGSIFPDLEAHQTVVSVGVMQLLGSTWIRSYLSDGRSFIETVADRADPSKSAQTRLYTLHTERTPATPDDWAFLLGAPAITQVDPETGGDTVTQEATPALIGYRLFQIDDPDKGAVLFSRAWQPGDTDIGPVTAVETITDAAGVSFRATHMLMAYSRVIGGVTEHLIAEAVETDDGAVFNASVGLDFDAAGLSVLAPA